jgi:hypothetical protein
MVFSLRFVKSVKHMTTDEKPIRIVGNESNIVYEIEPGSNSIAPKQNTTTEEDKVEQPKTNSSGDADQQNNNELATNDGAVIETLDTVFHKKPVVADGINPSGSSRADYYEERSNGQSDAEEEVNFSPNK